MGKVVNKYLIELLKRVYLINYLLVSHITFAMLRVPDI